MRRILLIAQREYLDNVRTKAFWIGILAFPIIIVLGALVPILLAETREARSYAVVDASGFVLQEVEERIIARDLREVFTATTERYREGGREFDKLSEVLQSATLVYVGLEEEERGRLVELVAETEEPGLEPEGLSAKTVQALPQLRTDLRQWWHKVSAKELEGLDVELSRRNYVRIETPRVDDPQAALNRMIDEGELFAYFVIAEDPVSSSDGCKYVSKNLTDRDLLNWFQRMAADVVRARRIEREGIDPQIAHWIQDSLRFDARKVGKRGTEEKVETRDRARQWAPVAFVYLLWIAVFTNAQALLTNTIEEKSSRVIEVLLSSVSSFELMAGKIAGMAASGLTVVGSWVIFFFTAIVVIPEMMGASDVGLGSIAADPFYMISFLVYFLTGYLLYATILVGIGSVCNSLKESQNLMMPILIPMLVPLFAMMPIGQDPNGMLARILSFIPLFTPFVMMNRAAGPPPLWEYLVTTLLMIGSIYLATKGAAKIFRIGILMTGKPPKLSEIIKWLTLSEGVMPESQEEGAA
jgi:ABC-2 type transport system permease protein